MIDIFSETEDQLVATVKALFYSADPAAIGSQIAQTVASLSADDQADLAGVAVNQVSYEQKLRREYVVESLLPGSQLDLTKQDVLVRAVAAGKLGEVTQTLGLETSVPNPSAEVIEQAKLYRAVAERLEAYQAEQYITPNIRVLHEDIWQMDSAQRDALAESIKRFLDQLDQAGGTVLGLTPEIPPTILESLQKTKIGLLVQNYETIGEKLKLLTIVRILALAAGRTIAAGKTAEDSLKLAGAVLSEGQIRWG